MALTKDQKQQIVSDVSTLLQTSKMTVITKYQGTTVKALQDLRRQARDDNTVVKVLKNRLVIKALKQSDSFKDIDVGQFEGMLLYAFNSDDEVIPAQNIANFAKTNPTLEFVGAISVDGNWLNADDVKALAELPNKEQLRSMLVGTISAPLSGFVGVLAGNLRGVINVLRARSKQLETAA